MFRTISCLFLSLAAATSLQAQTQPYNPYAPEVQDKFPVTPDGEINWPTFYKSVGLKNRFQLYFAMGSCVGTRKDIVDALEKNKVDINELGERSFGGRVLAAQGGILTILDDAREKITVVTHPAGVSRVDVSGEMPVQKLQPGTMVRLIGSVDQHGVAREPLTALNVFTPDADTRFDAVTPGRKQTIVGQVLGLRGARLQIKVEPGQLHRLTFLVTRDCRVSVGAHDVRLISPGDHIVATGHVYSADKSGPIVFANKVEAATAYQSPKPAAGSLSSN